ncbi:hypothetical protein [Streptomyces sp. NBC_00453]|uniref:hypothetical protein n=1 Tax=Streptomyces sp. NBC_00453 TaxID=2903653 RepID=UPI002E1B87A0
MADTHSPPFTPHRGRALPRLLTGLPYPPGIPAGTDARTSRLSSNDPLTALHVLENRL